MALRDFFRPKWKHSSAVRRQESVDTLTDQAVLRELAMHDSAPFVRIAAAAKLTDSGQGQSILAEIAKKHWMLEARRCALARVTDQATLSGIATADADPSMREAASAMLRQLNTNYCRLCRAWSLVGEGEFFTVPQLKEAISKGFRPEHRGPAGMLFSAVGVSRSNELISEIMSSEFGYAVCAECSGNIKKYL